MGGPLIASILREPMRELPQIVFTLRARHAFLTVRRVIFSCGAVCNLRKLDDIENVQNKVVDGAELFPKNQQALKSGISVEVRNVSFTIEASQLCVSTTFFVVFFFLLFLVLFGVDGFWKSTILNLICRIYDPTEGTIFIDNRDTKTLRLADLRAAMSVLIQDYTHFPLSISENIGLGNPALAHDYDKVREAARLGGAEHFIDELPDRFNMYLNCPVKYYYAGLPEGPMMLCGRSTGYSHVRGVDGLRTSEALSLSGG
ncbi:P-loop containing nucleoside triphosphate hydrolase protein [Suillus americanus]|nr:P-loop containing nucleoside triphosphate hydrolase protein [Suillus americanus]